MAGDPGGEVRASLAVTGGVHEPLDAVKAVMAGADAVQMVSALLQKGPDHLRYVRQMFERWGDEHGYASIDDSARQPEPEELPRPHRVRTWQLPADTAIMASRRSGARAGEEHLLNL